MRFFEKRLFLDFGVVFWLLVLLFLLFGWSLSVDSRNGHVKVGQVFVCWWMFDDLTIARRTGDEGQVDLLHLPTADCSSLLGLRYIERKGPYS